MLLGNKKNDDIYLLDFNLYCICTVFKLVLRNFLNIHTMKNGFQNDLPYLTKPVAFVLGHRVNFRFIYFPYPSSKIFSLYSNRMDLFCN